MFLRMTFKPVAMGLLTAAVAGCGSSGGGDKTDANSGPANTKYELNMTDELAPPANMTPIDESAIGSKINRISDFYQRRPSSSNGDSDSSNTDLSGCDALKNVKFNSGMGYIEMQMDEDLVGCFQGNERRMIESFRLAMFMRMECPDDDLSQYNGKTLFEASSAGAADKICGRSATRRQISWSRVNAEMNLFGKVKTTSINGMANASGKPCDMTVRDGLVTYGDCVKYQRQVDDIPSDSGSSNGGLKMTADNKIVTVNLNGVTGDESSRYYTSGVANFRINNWNGQMTYAGGDRDPAWTAESDGRKKSGIFVGKRVSGQTSSNPSTTPGGTANFLTEAFDNI